MRKSPYVVAGRGFARSFANYLARDADTLALPIGTHCAARYERGACRDAQEAVRLWLVRQAHIVVDPRYPARPAINAAADRFGAPPEETRRAWRRAHRVALREGRVPLSELP